MLRDLPSRHRGGNFAGFARAGVEGSFWTRKRLLILLSLITCTLLSLVYLWQSWQWVYWLNQLHQAEARRDELQAENDQLKFQIAQAFSLVRVEQIATQRLGMIHPPLQYLILPPFVP